MWKAVIQGTGMLTYSTLGGHLAIQPLGPRGSASDGVGV